MEEKLSEGTRYIPYNLVTRPSSFVKKVARRLNELIIGVKMCNICISVCTDPWKYQLHPIGNTPTIFLFLP